MFGKSLKKSWALLAIAGIELALVGNTFLPACSSNRFIAPLTALADEYTEEVASAPQSLGVAFDKPMVSLNFDDGWHSQYANASKILNEAGIKGGFYIITNESAAAGYKNFVENPTFDVEGGSEGLPYRWFIQSSGENKATSEYPARGYRSSCGAKVEMKEHVDGSAEWVFNDASVIPDHNYKYSNVYSSTATTSLYARFTYRNGSMRTKLLKVVAPSLEWKSLENTFRIPLDVEFVTVYQSLSTDGELTIDNVELTHVERYMNMQEAVELRKLGHEVMAHSKSHANLAMLTYDKMKEEILGSKAALEGQGILPQNIFVYPFGSYNQDMIALLKENGFIGARSVKEGYNFKNTSIYELRVHQVDQTTSLEEFKDKVDWTIANNAWSIFMFHQVDDDKSFYSGSPALFRQMVAYLQSKGVAVVTLEEGVNAMLR